MDLLSLLSKHGVPFRSGGEHRHVREGWIGIDCPWCSGPGEGGFHLGIHLTTLAASCWRCGRHRLGDSLSRLLRLPLHEVLPLLGEVPRGPRIDSEAGLREGVLEHPPGLGPLSEPHLAYLKGRGFDPVSLEQLWGLRGLGIAPRLGWRIWIPIHLDGRVVTWTTRSIGEGTLRYVNARPEQELVPIKSLLYGWDRVRSAAVVCEGPTDAWRIGPGAVATMGVNATEDQIELLSRIPRRIVCFDSEPAAQRRAEELCRVLRTLPGETERAVLSSGDPGEADGGELRELREMLT